MTLWLSLAAWFALLVFTARASWRVMRGKGKDHDALSFSYHMVGWVMIGFSARWVFAPENMAALSVMRCFSVALAIFLIVSARLYRRV